ncbi:MAG: glycosyltransferase [Ignavibacteria bacterium]|nr:glycosyltransferase [Ignavibacteria bacterium]
MILDLLILISLVLYLVQVGILIRGLTAGQAQPSSTEKPRVSVVIAARNEEQHLASCLESVLHQTYPSFNYEVVVVNDHSTDRSAEICSSYAKRTKNVRTISPPRNGEFKGKTNALIHGIEQCTGKIILITDADCIVPPTWIEHTVKYYAPNMGVVGGMTLQFARTRFEGMQSLDWAYLLGLASSAVAHRNPLSTIGNNLSFRRNAYDSVGGYRKIKFSITEDYALFQAIIREGTWDYAYPIAPELLVMTEPCPTLRSVWRQKHRWGKGGLDMKLSGFLVMGIGFATHALILTGLVTGSVAIAGGAFLVKCMGDYAFLHRVLSRLQRLRELRFFYSFQLYFISYVLILPFVVFMGGKVLWKDRQY